MTTTDIKVQIEQLRSESPLNHTEERLVHLCAALAENIMALEADMDKVRKFASKTANAASCLANGIQPD